MRLLPDACSVPATTRVSRLEGERIPPGVGIRFCKSPHRSRASLPVRRDAHAESFMEVRIQRILLSCPHQTLTSDTANRPSVLSASLDQTRLKTMHALEPLVFSFFSYSEEATERLAKRNQKWASGRTSGDTRS